MGVDAFVAEEMSAIRAAGRVRERPHHRRIKLVAPSPNQVGRTIAESSWPHHRRIKLVDHLGVEAGRVRERAAPSPNQVGRTIAESSWSHRLRR
jgi:hypothetical protein